jgi:hypothetical protein
LTFSLPLGGCGKANSAAEAKKQLLETAEKFEGPFAAVVKSHVEQVESGNWPISMADEEMAKGKFTRETRDAYQVWRKAYLAEKKK